MEVYFVCLFICLYLGWLFWFVFVFVLFCFQDMFIYVALESVLELTS